MFSDCDSLDLNNNIEWIFCTARYIFCILILVGTKAICLTTYEMVCKRRSWDLQLLTRVKRHQLVLFVTSLALLLSNGQKLYAEQFHFVLAAYFIIKYPEIGIGTKLSCGVVIACGYVEGYLTHVIPSNGADVVGLLGHISNYESSNGVVFPVKKLFIIITKSMYCPPDLKDYNVNTARSVAKLEACKSLGKVVKDVASVKNREYINSVYKIHRPGKRPVYITAECVTSLHTFYNVLKNKDIAEELGDVCVEEIVADFDVMLRRILSKSQELKNKCEVVYFDNTKNLNLADVLLDRIQELAPGFEDFINSAK